MGFGIDGYCCEVADQIKEKEPQKKIDYTGIAIKGLLFHFKPCHAEITVDGVKHEFDNVWIAPTMKGRYYGGGMEMAPSQVRSSDILTVVVYHCRSKLKALISFPSIFKGEHVKKTDIVQVFTGNEIEVRFSRPCAAQIDGETVLDVSEYKAVLPKA
jgi:diacylglycerol kinase family enzyme